MTTYIDNIALSAKASLPGSSAHGLPGAGLGYGGMMPSLLTLWSLPLATFQIWANGWSSFLSRSAATSANDEQNAQLPVPAPLRRSDDTELFA